MPVLGDLSALTDRTFAAVIFDNDGTLVDSTPAVVRSWQTWAVEHDVPADAFGDFHGMPAADIIAKLAPTADPGEALARITALEVADMDGVVALPGAVDAVEALLPGRAAVATSATHELGYARLAAAGIPLPGVTVTFDDVENGKPAPDPFLLAAKRLGVDPADCLVVEDANSGLAGARAAGCATLAVTTTMAAEDLNADAAVTSLADVRFVVDGDRVQLRAARNSSQPR